MNNKFPYTVEYEISEDCNSDPMTCTVSGYESVEALKDEMLEIIEKTCRSHKTPLGVKILVHFTITDGNGTYVDSDEAELMYPQNSIMPVFTVVVLFGGIVQNVYSYQRCEDAQAHWENQTGLSWSEYEEYSNADHEKDEIRVYHTALLSRFEEASIQ